MDTTTIAHHICRKASLNGQRTGQYLFNGLRPEIADKVSSSLIDPFHKDLTNDEVKKWLDDHIIFAEDGEQIGLFDGNKILWEKE